MTRLAVVVSHPVQYFSPWFRHLTANSSASVRIFYLWDCGTKPTLDPGFGKVVQWDVPLLDGYEHEFVPNVSDDPGTHHFGGLDNPSLVSRLATWQPDAVLLFGYSYRSHMRVMLSRRLRRIPLLFRGDSHDIGRTAGIRAEIGRRLRRALFRRFSDFLSVGSAHRQYLLNSGVPASRIHHVPHCVDNARFRSASADAARSSLDWRRAHGIPATATVALFAGKLEPKKAPDLLLRAFLALHPVRPSDSAHNVLLFVGSGVLELELRRLAGERTGQDVFFVPFQNQTVMPTVYAAADVLVLPSGSNSETWGLVVNEAMNLARPAIVSDRVGCGPDLVTHGETGWVFPSGNEARLCEALALAFADRARLVWMGEAARRRIDHYSYDVATAALEQVLGAKDSARRSPDVLNAPDTGFATS